MNVEHMFETTEGDELSTEEMRNASWRVVETMVDIDASGSHDKIVFTHRVQVHSIDDLTVVRSGGGE